MSPFHAKSSYLFASFWPLIVQVAYAYMGVCACACECALSWWTNQVKVWIWSLDYGSSVSWFTCRWCHPLAVHSVLRQREPPCSQSLEKLEAQKAFQYFNATRCEEQKTQTDACSLRLSYNCHFFFFVEIQKNLFCIPALSKLKWRTFAAVIHLQTSTLM